MSEDEVRAGYNEAELETLHLASNMRHLVETVWWKAYDEALGALMTSHVEALFPPCLNFRALLRAEYTKGTINGLSLARNHPHAIIEGAAQVRADALSPQSGEIDGRQPNDERDDSDSGYDASGARRESVP